MIFQLVSFILVFFIVGCGQNPSSRFFSGQLTQVNTIEPRPTEKPVLALNFALGEEADPQAQTATRAKHILCVGEDYNEEKLKTDLPPFFKEGNSINTRKKDLDGNEIWCPQETDPEKWVCLADTFLYAVNTGCPYRKGINAGTLKAYEKFCKDQPKVRGYKKPAYLHPSDENAECKVCSELEGTCEDPADKSFSATSVGNYACLVKKPAP